MPDLRRHRGAHPEDDLLFAPSQRSALQAASSELHWLLDRGYALKSSLALTGDRHGLTQRQRLAVARCACSFEAVQRRATRQLAAGALAGRQLWIDGYNLLITLEAALAGAVILQARDGCFRDMASLHGTYREVAETGRAAELVGEALERLGVGACRWLLDRPVGNSARLKSRLIEQARANDWSWEVALEESPDRQLSETTAIVATSDSVVLDRCSRWWNTAREIIEREVPNANVVDLSATGAGAEPAGAE